MEKQNVTLSLPKNLVRDARHIAIERGTSLSALLSEELEQLVQRNREHSRATRNFLRRLKKGYNLGTFGKATWTREELHERR